MTPSALTNSPSAPAFDVHGPRAGKGTGAAAATLAGVGRAFTTWVRRPASGAGCSTALPTMAIAVG